MAELALHPAQASIGARLARVPGVAWMLAFLVIGFALSAESFLSGPNLINIGLQSVILLMLALPMTLIIMTEGLDISMGAVLTLASVVLAWMLAHGSGLPVALACALLTGMLFGLLNGSLVALLKLPPFVVTLGTLGAAQGLALVVTDGQSIVNIGQGIQSVYAGRLLGIPIPLWMGAIAYALTHVLLYHTRFGTYVFAMGGNRDALQLAGIRADRYLIAVYVFGGLMAGMASLLLTARMNSGHPTAAIGMEFDAIAAVIVGGTSFERGNGWLAGTLLGVLTVGALRNGLNLMSVASSVQVACIGLLVILALLIDGLKVRR